MVTNEDLARAAIAGDRSALEQLTRQLLDVAYRLSLRALGDASEAEAAAQEIVITAVTHLSQFEFRSSVTTWLTTQAIRTLARWSKRRSVSEPTPVETITQRLDVGLSMTTAGSLPEGEVAVFAREVQIGCTQGMLAALGDTERMAYLVGAILGASDVVGAELLETTPEAFRQRLSRARARMQPVLEARCGLVNGALPCRCTRQAAAKQKAEPTTTLRFVDAVALSAATEELGELLALGQPFRESPPLGAPRALWARVLSSFPRLTGPTQD